MALFREEAVAAQQTQVAGRIVIVSPPSFMLLTAFAAFLALTVGAFFAWGTYTKRSTIQGQLLPDSGLLKIYAPQTGIVMEKMAAEGQHVEAGQILYTLSSDRMSSSMGATQAAVSEQVEQRRASLLEEIKKTLALHEEERKGLDQKVSALEREEAQLRNQIQVQQDRLKLAQTAAERYEELLRKDYISREQLQQKQEEFLEQKSRQQSLERDLTVIRRELSGHQAELAGLSLKQKNQISQLERLLSNANQELSESEAKRRIAITAPQAGIATAVIAEVGQLVDGTRPLLSLVPANAKLQADLYAPSKAVGFVKPGDQVLIRYQAYPYQKFGHQHGTVETVSKTALSKNEISSLGYAAHGGNTDEPLYRITVKLKSQTVNAYGEPQKLQAGALLEADVLQEKRRLYEWVLEPLYSLSGKF